MTRRSRRCWPVSTYADAPLAGTSYCARPLIRTTVTAALPGRALLSVGEVAVLERPSAACSIISFYVIACTTMKYHLQAT